MSYIGSTPTTQSFIAGTDYFNGTGSQVTFTLSRSVNSVNDIEVIVNNVEQIPSGYSVSGTTLTFSAAPSAGTSNVYVRYLSTTNLSLAIPAGTSATFNTVTATNLTATNLTVTNGASIQGLTVGRGAGAVSTNTAVGYQAAYSNTTGTRITAVGMQALYSNTTGIHNSGFGYDALQQNTTGQYNTAVGYQSLISNTTAERNTAVGYQAGYTPSTSNENTFVGYKAGFAKTTGDANTFIGNQSGVAATTGVINTFVGASSGNTITTGSKNTILGSYNGNQGGLDIRTANNYIVLSDGDGNPRAWVGAGNNNDLFRVGTVSTSTSSFMHSFQYDQNSRYVCGFTNTTSLANPNGVIIEYSNSNSTSGSDNLLYCGISTGQRASFRNNGGLANFQANDANLSDRREKTNFAPAKSYLDVICAIPVQTFNYVDQDLENDPGLTLGVVAQDVQAVAPELITESNWGTKETPKMRLSIYQTDLQYALMKAIQEQQTLITALTARITALEAK